MDSLHFEKPRCTYKLDLGKGNLTEDEKVLGALQKVSVGIVIVSSVLLEPSFTALSLERSVPLGVVGNKHQLESQFQLSPG